MKVDFNRFITVGDGITKSAYFVLNLFLNPAKNSVNIS